MRLMGLSLALLPIACYTVTLWSTAQVETWAWCAAHQAQHSSVAPARPQLLDTCCDGALWIQGGAYSQIAEVLAFPFGEPPRGRACDHGRCPGRRVQREEQLPLRFLPRLQEVVQDQRRRQGPLKQKRASFKEKLAIAFGEEFSVNWSRCGLYELVDAQDRQGMKVWTFVRHKPTGVKAFLLGSAERLRVSSRPPWPLGGGAIPRRCVAAKLFKYLSLWLFTTYLILTCLITASPTCRRCSLLSPVSLAAYWAPTISADILARPGTPDKL